MAPGLGLRNQALPSGVGCVHSLRERPDACARIWRLDQAGPAGGHKSRLSIDPREELMLKTKRRDQIFAINVALAALMASPGRTAAEVYPSRPITIVVPYPPGRLFDGNAPALAG